MVKKFYSPVFIRKYVGDELARITFKEANGYIEKINDCVQKDIDNTFDDGNFACYFDSHPEITAKIQKVTLAIEKHLNKPMCVACVDYNKSLTNDEWSKLSDYFTGQYSDGFGEGFEQHPVMVDNTELYVSFWGYEGYFIRDTVSPKKSK